MFGSRVVVFSELPTCTWGYFSSEVKVFFFFTKPSPSHSWSVFVFYFQRVAVSILGPKAAYLGVVLPRHSIYGRKLTFPLAIITCRLTGVTEEERQCQQNSRVLLKHSADQQLHCQHKAHNFSVTRPDRSSGPYCTVVEFNTFL